MPGWKVVKLLVPEAQQKTPTSPFKTGMLFLTSTLWRMYTTQEKVYDVGLLNEDSKIYI